MEGSSYMRRSDPGGVRVSVAGLYEFSLRQLIQNALLLLMSLLLSSYAPFSGVSPFGAACVMAAWFCGLDPYFAAAGALSGYLITGEFVYAAAVSAMAAGVFLITRRRSPQRVYRLLILFCIELIALLTAGAIAGERLAVLFGASTVSVFSAVVMGSGIKAFEGVQGFREPNDTELLTLASLAGLITLAMRNFEVLGVSPAVVFAGACALFSAYRFGITSVAVALTVGAGRSLAAGTDMRFIAVAASMALVAASVRSLGKWASLIAFTIAGAALTISLGSSGTVNYWELGIIALIFALVPKRLYMSEDVKARSSSGYSRLEYRVAMISEVLGELSRVFGGDTGTVLGCVSTALKAALDRRPAAPAYMVGCGTASSPREGSVSGDSCTVKNADGKLLLAISDGMGSGTEASRESRAALALLKDLLTVGFDIGGAVSCVNSLLASRGSGDMYATLDVMLIDLSTGRALVSKHGAPSSFILRGGRVYRLYSEGLPIGIIEGAFGEARDIALRPGDTVIMMSDGVSDALGETLSEAIKSAAKSPSPDSAAEAILSAAGENAKDDMTVVLARIYSAG